MAEKRAVTSGSKAGGETNAPSFAVDRKDGKAVLRLTGDWSVLTVGEIAAKFQAGLADAGKILELDLSGVTRMDTAGALLVRLTAGRDKPKIATDDESVKRLLALVADAEGACLPEGRKASLAIRFLNDLGGTIMEESRLVTRMIGFLGHYLATCLAVVLKSRKLPLTSLVYHMQQVGVSAVPIVALLSFLIGLVIAYMGAQQLAMFGAQIFTIKLVEITTLRELGVLLTSIVIAGRSGSSFTAQIGAMVANEEVAAMRTMGLSPMLRLAFPRITALLLMLPALVFLSDIMGILGGGVAALTIMDLTPEAYAIRMQEAVNLNNFMVGMVKAPFFAVVIGVVGCFQGFQVTGSAESVGKLTTRAVVEAIFAVILLDAMFALFFTGINV